MSQRRRRRKNRPDLAGSGRIRAPATRGGVTAVATSEYLRVAIIDPQAQLVDGFQTAIMPTNYGTSLTSSEIDALVAYIETLPDES